MCLGVDIAINYDDTVLFVAGYYVNTSVVEIGVEIMLTHICSTFYAVFIWYMI